MLSTAVSAFVFFSLFVLQSQPPAQPTIEKLGDGLLRVHNIRVDTKAREISVPGRINRDMTGTTTLEFVANVAGHGKAYETPIAAETDAVAFNAALLLIGLDPKNARVPTRHFDPVPPAGDAVEVLIEWTKTGATKRVPVEDLLWDQRARRSMTKTPWVYTGSSFYEGKYLASMDGVLIGFVHSPAPIIENAGAGAVDAFGSIVFNTRLGLVSGDRVTLIVRAVTSAK
jgi:hypothetical protein